jgi:hypothetical protein
VADKLVASRDRFSSVEFVKCHIGTHAVIRNDISYMSGKWVGGRGENKNIRARIKCLQLKRQRENLFSRDWFSFMEL